MDFKRLFKYLKRLLFLFVVFLSLFSFIKFTRFGVKHATFIIILFYLVWGGIIIYKRRESFKRVISYGVDMLNHAGEVKNGNKPRQRKIKVSKK